MSEKDEVIDRLSGLYRTFKAEIAGRPVNDRYAYRAKSTATDALLGLVCAIAFVGLWLAAWLY